MLYYIRIIINLAYLSIRINKVIGHVPLDELETVF